MKPASPARTGTTPESGCTRRSGSGGAGATTPSAANPPLADSTAPVPWGFELWKHLHDNHGLILVESELQEIVDIARRLPVYQPDPYAGHPEIALDFTTPAYVPPRYVHAVCGNNPCTCPLEDKAFRQP